jgi:phytoene synthase
LVARVLGETSIALDPAGKGWALADLARQTRDPMKAEMLLDLTRPLLDAAFSKSWPGRLRALGMLAALAREDARRGADALRPPASRARLVRLLLHRWTGR